MSLRYLPEKGQVVNVCTGELERAVRSLGVPEDREPFLTMAFSALPVIPI